MSDLSITKELSRELARLTKEKEVLVAALRRIATYDSPESVRMHAEETYGLDGDEALEMAYENIQQEANAALAAIELADRRPG